MNVLMVTGSLPPMKCGVGDYSMQLALALASQPGIRVTLLSSVAAATALGRVTVLPLMTGWRLRDARTAWRAIRASGADVVHVQYPTQGYGRGLLPGVIPLLARLAGAAAIQTWHELIPRREVLLRALTPTDVFVIRPNFLARMGRRTRMVLGRSQFHYVAGASALPVATLATEESSALRERALQGQQRLIVFVGFVYPHKGVELLFDIASPELDHIVIVGEVVDQTYRSLLEERAGERWRGKVTYTGFVPAEEAAAWLAVADAVVLPFRDGGGDWNSSLHAAIANCAYVVTTSRERRGYDEDHHVAYAPVDDIAEMQRALNLATVRGRSTARCATPSWPKIAVRHIEIYRRLLGTGGSSMKS